MFKFFKKKTPGRYITIHMDSLEEKIFEINRTLSLINISVGDIKSGEPLEDVEFKIDMHTKHLRRLLLEFLDLARNQKR